MRYTEEKLKEWKDARETVLVNKGYKYLDEILKQYVTGSSVAVLGLTGPEYDILLKIMEREKAVSELFEISITKRDDDIYIVRIEFKD